MRNKLILALAIVVFAITDVSQGVAIDWVTVDDVENVADDTGYGSVTYEYRIGKHEVTIAQYIEFLNAVAITDTH